MPASFRGMGSSHTFPLAAPATASRHWAFKREVAQEPTTSTPAANTSFPGPKTRCRMLDLGWAYCTASSSYSSSFGGMTVSGKSSSSDLYFNVGGGVRYFVNERWGFRPELMLFAGSNTYVRFGGGIFYYLGSSTS